MAETSCFLSSPKLPGKRFSMDLRCRRRVGAVVKATRESNDSEYGGKLVDKNMIVLRMRIKEMSTLEKHEMSHSTTSAEASPSDWIEQWENKHFANYNEDVCEAVGLLQLFLMNTRPALAVGLVVLIALTVFLSTSVVMFNAVEIAVRLLKGLH